MQIYIVLIVILLFTPFYLTAQESKGVITSQNDSVLVAKAKSSQLQLGGYGEAVMQRMFYSDNAARYSYPESYKGATHGRFDLPHVVLYAAYNFGRGWEVSMELEYEHGGTGATYEIENAEAGEYEVEIEKGGEVGIEQFWIEKSFADYANLRMGHIIAPVGITNEYFIFIA